MTYEETIIERIERYTVNLIYWEKKAEENLKLNNSPYYALSVALEYAKEVEVEKARLRDSFDWNKLYKKAVKLADKKLKDDTDGL
jgi:hypothetical protein